MVLSKKFLLFLMVIMLSLTIGFIACSDDGDDDDPAPVPITTGISGTLTFPSANTAGAMAYISAWPSSLGDATSNASHSTAFKTKPVLSSAVTTYDFELGTDAGTYYVSCAIYQSGVAAGPPGTGDFVGYYDATDDSGPTTTVTVVDDEITEDIDITLVAKTK